VTRKFPFTRRAVESLPAHDPASPSREAEYSDAGCSTLRLSVSKQGRKAYLMRYTYRGRKRCLSLGEHTEVFGPQEARRMVAEHKACIGRDVDPAEEREKRRADLTFAEFAEQHYLPLARARKKSIRTDEYWIRKQLTPAVGNRPLKGITQRDVAQLCLKEKERSSATGANHLLAILKVVMSTAVKLGFAERNPCTGHEKYKEPPPRDRYLSREELPRFLAALEGAGTRLHVAALRLLVFTGMRRMECTSLTWEQVFLDEHRVLLRVTKNKRPRSVQLNSRALAVIRELAAQRDSDPVTRDSPHLFPSLRSDSKLGHILDLRKAFDRACEKAGITGVRVHDLRRTFGSWGVMSGQSIYSVQKLLGHRDVAVTESTYAHLSSDALHGASEGIVGMLEVAEAEAAQKRKAAAEAGAGPEGEAAHPEPGERAVG